MGASIGDCAIVQCSGSSRCHLLVQSRKRSRHVQEHGELTDLHRSMVVEYIVIRLSLHETFLHYGQAFSKALPKILVHCYDVLYRVSCMDCTQQLLQHLQVIQGAGGWSVFHRKENTDCTARFMIGFAVVSANDDPAPVVVIEAPMLRTPVQG